jgi:hypothetical protein
MSSQGIPTAARTFRALHMAIAKTKRPTNGIFHVPSSSIIDEEAYLDGSSDTCACLTTNLSKVNLPPRPTPELFAVDDTNDVSKNKNEESFVDSDKNSRDDSSGRVGHSLHHLYWRYHTYHGVARWLSKNNNQQMERIRWSKQSNSALLPITSCGLSHTSLFKTGLNETSTILEQSDNANGLFTHFSSNASRRPWNI